MRKEEIISKKTPTNSFVQQPVNIVISSFSDPNSKVLDQPKKFISENNFFFIFMKLIRPETIQPRAVY